MSFSEKLILALDFPSCRQALHWVDLCIPYIKKFKVGSLLFTREGPQIIREIQKKGGEVFLDLKYHDIPTTVAQAGRVAAELGVFMFDVHAMGGIEMMQRVRQTIDQTVSKRKPLIVAVTVLTSLSQGDTDRLGFHDDSKNLVLRYASMAQEAGLDGVVCSVDEVSAVKKTLGPSFLTVTPGIRFEENSRDDQKRIAGPQRAIEQGADYLVLGRAIFEAKHPLEVLKTTLEKFSYA